MALPVLRNNRTLRPFDVWNPGWSLREFDELTRLLTTGPNGESHAFAPAADVRETDEAYVVEVEVPGVKRDDITVDLADNVLTVSGEVNEREGRFRRRTRRTGQFRYSVSLPEGIDTEQVGAELADGVLTVNVPKRPDTGTRRIEIS
ncbi:Hsp20/alpha crystallin family protein [Prauserella rugosa]|uniref:HSP20 family protein n=1 Tax=Prauserella rugosa TaxID=43354 RepID=A0A660C412_9PSEU|nr:Hsp20/alpha crystallin family protein [Prauserella rugosa]KID28214.1 molecular chaperone (small heat shock protein) [Prauserella sp. Am3]KMS83083.1 hypothetical protein ACZ91_55050 [Streptomyces regensis]TWH18242.1 HSP20 family protein [Prauserella rugosa]